MVIDTLRSLFTSDPEKALSEKERAYRMLVASTLFGLDGLSRAEREELQRRATTLGQHALVAAASEERAEHASFELLVRRHGAIEWTDTAKKDFAEWMLKMARLDGEYSPEEKAFLIQMAQVMDGHDRVPLFIAVPAAIEVHAAEHAFFRYLTKTEFEALYPNSECMFESGQIYTLHPFYGSALLPFREDAFYGAQSSAALRMVELVQALGAKRCHIKRIKTQVLKASLDQAASVKALVEGIGDLDLQSSLGANFTRKQSETEEWEGEFEGGTPLLRRFLPFLWWRRFNSRFEEFSEHRAIIRQRVGSNRVRSFKHVVRQESATALGLAMSSAMKIDTSLTASQSSSLKGSRVVVVEREFEVTF